MYADRRNRAYLVNMLCKNGAVFSIANNEAAT
jgi:hypothetical protein